MELLLQAIEKKLSHVDGERKRWIQYKEEHEQASDNLREFQKSFHKEIMVPIGSKALIPGHLYHTNEIFVSMYQGLFVKCSTDKALTVCEHRLGEANKWIEALNAEHKMYKDRLELPTDVSAFANTDATQEIIEEYNEEDEKQWREQHKIRMREHKKAEAEERKRISESNDIDINAILEEAELMEELENDLEMLSVNDDEQLMQHLQSNDDASVEHIEHEAQSERFEDSANDTDGDSVNDTDEMGTNEFSSLNAAANGLNIEDKIKFFEIHLQKTQDYFRKNHCTIHNFNEFTDKRVTEECLQNAIEELHETLNNTTESSDTQPNKDAIQENKQRVNTNESRKFHNRYDFDAIEREYAEQNKGKSELLIFYKSQLRSVMKSIAGCTIDLHSKEEKRQLYELISDRISSLREEIQREKIIKFEEEFVDDEDITRSMNKLNRNFGMNNINDEDDDDTTGKRKISFASQPITVTFYEDDEPSRVSQESIDELMDSTFQFFNSPSSSSASSVCGDDDDNNKNGGNEQINHPMNSTNDCDMNFPMNQCSVTEINKVENSLTAVSNKVTGSNKSTTIILQFDHSPNICTVTASDNNDDINNPLDIYKQFGADNQSPNRILSLQSVNVNQSLPSKNTTQNRNQINEFGDNTKGKSLNDSTSVGDRTLGIPNIHTKPTKSILKNRNLVNNESRGPSISDDIEEPMESNKPKDENPGFTEVLGDIVERDQDNTSSQSTSTNSEPKKRVSLFKKSRMS